MGGKAVGWQGAMMAEEKVFKARTTRAQRFLRLIASLLDPRALGHMAKIVNYYNVTHVAELRRARRGRSMRISPTTSFANGHNIVLGDRVHLGAGTSLWAGPDSARIVLGDDVLIAPNVMITAANYRFNEGSPVTDQAMDEAEIRIGRDVWIGFGAVILPGVTIGDGAIIGAASVVRRDVGAGAIVAGNPARVVGQRDPRSFRAAPL